MTQQIYDFLDRVRSYKLGKWTHYSHRLSPYVLAIRGFKAISNNIAQCHTCHIQVSFEGLQVGQDNQSLEHQLLQKIAVHNENCIYGQSEETLFKLTRELLYENMGELYGKLKDSYKFHKGRLPSISQHLWNRYLAPFDSLFSKLDEKFGETKEVYVPQILSIFGWQLVTAEKPCLQCLFCGRTLKLEHYITGENERQRISSDQQTDKYLDPIEEHRYFCLWGNTLPEQTTQPLFGWQICLRHLQDKSLQAEKGWTTSNKFEEVAKARQQFNRLLDGFTNKTRESMSKLVKLLDDCKRLVHEQPGHNAFQKNAETTKQSIDNLVRQLEEVKDGRTGNKKLKI